MSQTEPAAKAGAMITLAHLLAPKGREEARTAIIKNRNVMRFLLEYALMPSHRAASCVCVMRCD